MKTNYTRYYRRWHDDSPEHLAAMKRHFQRRLAPHLPEDKNAALLDVGCGMGFTLEALQGMGYSRIEGIDMDEAQVAAALAQHRPVTHVGDTVAWLQQRTGRYDAVLLLDVLEHIAPDVQISFLAAIHAALLPNGKLICTVPNANSTLATRQRYIDWTHRTAFTEHSLDFALYNAGFRHIAVFGDDGPRPRFPWLLPRWRLRWWYLRNVFRAIRRLQLLSELGPEAWDSPLSLNLFAVAGK